MIDRANTSSVPVRVTFFEDRAEVVRAASTSAPAGLSRIVLGGLSPFLDERSVQASAKGARVVSARAFVTIRDPESAGGDPAKKLEDEAELADREAATAALRLDRATRAASRARGLLEAWLLGAATAPRDASKAETKARWEIALREIDVAAGRALEQASAARREHADASERASRARAKVAAARTSSPRHEGVVTIDVEAEADAEVSLDVTYRVACALWRPEHLVRTDAVGAEGRATIEIVSYATAWQHTGEDWEGVTARFSTARPGRDASAPLLTDDVLTLRRRADPKHVEVGVRDQSIQTAGLDRGARAVDEMPGVDDGGEPLAFEAREKLTLASDGRPVRVEIAAATLDATIERVAFPEVAGVAHLRATATLTGRAALLAGPVRIVRDRSLVGRGRVGFVGAGEPFEIGLGLDDGLRVKRQLVAERDTTAVLGTQKVKRKVSVFASNLSGSARRLIVTERVPVSEIEAVEVKLLDAAGWTIDAEGIARRSVDIAPRATRTLELVYEIRAGSNVSLPF